MTLKNFKVMGILLLLLAVFAVGGKKVSAAVEDRDVQYTIGVVVYNQNSPEMNMFMNYYREYIQQGFPVKFYFSGSINSAEDEINFIRAMKLQGVSGIISFYGQDIQKIVEACDEEEMYYVLGSGSISDEDYDKVKTSPYFLGSVGPDAKADYEAGYNMADYFSNFVEYFPRLMEGLKLTIIIAIFGILLAVALGIILCIFSISNSRILQKIASVYITIIRGIPLMILALFLYFGVIKNSLTLVLAAIIILGINASAYMAEIFRAGIQAIDYGQMEAARSLGLSYFQTMRKIVLPQAVKIMIPSLMNQFISSLKDTAILSAISVNELTMTAKTIIARNYKAFELYSYAAIIYIVLITALTWLSKKVERRLSYDKR